MRHCKVIDAELTPYKLGVEIMVSCLRISHSSHWMIIISMKPIFRATQTFEDLQPVSLEVCTPGGQRKMS